MNKANPHTVNLWLKTRRLYTNPWIPATLYLCAIGITEFVLYYFSVQNGVGLYYAILITIIVHSTMSHNEAQRGLWIALGLVPLIRIMGTVIPIAELSVIIWYILIWIPVLVGIYSVARYLKYSFDDIGINYRNILGQILTAITGIGLGIIDYMILKPEPLVEGYFTRLIFPAIILFIFTGFMEELAFRGVIQKATRTLGSLGWVFIALVYAVLQIGYGSLIHIVFTLAVALYFGLVVQKTKSIIGVSMAHGLLNILLFLVMPNIIR